MCPIDGCQFRTATQADQDTHLAIVHSVNSSSAATAKCVQCNMYFNNQDDLNAHILKEHFNNAVDAYYGTGSVKSNQHCVSTNVGGRIQIFCKSY